MTNYGAFAKFYDSAMGDRKNGEKFIEELIKKYNPQAKTILELGCGKGMFLEYFSDLGYSVVGIDTSEEMLSIARQKVPNAHLSHQDISNFSLSGRYDVVLCIFDTMNHLLNYENWEHAFSRAYRHLNGGGIFIFDINTRQKLEKLTQSNPIIRILNDGRVVISVIKEMEIYNWDIKVMKGGINGGEVVSSENIKECSFPIIEIERSLKKMFKGVDVIDGNGDRASEVSDRIYFICAKSI